MKGTRKRLLCEAVGAAEFAEAFPEGLHQYNAGETVLFAATEYKTVELV